jgi:hypothetical protein
MGWSSAGKKKKDGRGRGGFHGSTAFPRRPRWNDGRWARQSWPLMLHEPWAACALDAFPCDTPRSTQRPITTRSSRSWLGVHCVDVGESPGSCSSSKQEPAERNEFPSISGLQPTYSVQSILSVSQDTHRGREYPDTQTYPDTPRYSYQSSQSSLRRRAPQCSPSSPLYCFALLATGLVWHPHSSAIGRGCCSVCPPGLAPVNHIPYAPRTLYGAWAAGPWSGR